MDDLDEGEIARLGSLGAGALVTQILSTAAALGVADALGGDASGSGSVATRCGAHPSAVFRLLRGLAYLGVVEQLDTDLFALTDLGHLLRRDHPRSMRAWVTIQGALLAPLWGGLHPAVANGDRADELVFGRPFYEHLAAHPNLDADWNAAMAETARVWLLEPLVDALDWSGVGTVVDVGGGLGGLLAGLLPRYPHLHGVLVDLPHVVEAAPPLLETAGVAARVEIVGADFTEEVPAGGDCYLLARVLFNWSDDRALQLLRSCASAMAPTGRLVVVDQVLHDDIPRHPAALNDLSLLTLGGRASTVDEWTQLLGRAGLTSVGDEPAPTAEAWTCWVVESTTGPHQ